MRLPEEKKLQKAGKKSFSFDVNEHKQLSAIEQAFLNDSNARAIIDEDYSWVAFNKAYAKEFYNFFGSDLS